MLPSVSNLSLYQTTARPLIIMIRSIRVLLFLLPALCEDVDVQFTIKKETNLAFDAVKFIDNLVTGNYTVPNNTENNTVNLFQSLVNKDKVSLLKASDLLCVNGSCIEEVLPLPPPRVLTTTALPTTTTVAATTSTTTVPYTSTITHPTSTTTQPIETTQPISTTAQPTQQTTTPQATQPATMIQTTPPPVTQPAASSESPTMVIIAVALGVIAALVSVILYFTMSGKQTESTSQKALSAPLLQPPNPHVLRIAIDWPPRPPPEIKTACNHLQGWSHQA